jgi:hypothetical protein
MYQDQDQDQDQGYNHYEQMEEPPHHHIDEIGEHALVRHNNMGFGRTVNSCMHCDYGHSHNPYFQHDGRINRFDELHVPAGIVVYKYGPEHPCPFKEPDSDEPNGVIPDDFFDKLVILAQVKAAIDSENEILKNKKRRRTLRNKKKQENGNKTKKRK